MTSAFVRTTLVGVLAAAALTAGWPVRAGAAGAPLSQVRIARHFDLAGYQMPENIALEPDGVVDLSFSAARQIVRLHGDGRIEVLATLPLPADGTAPTPVTGVPVVTGLVLADDGTRFFLYSAGSADLNGLWSLAPGGTPRRIAALPADGMPNGLTLDEATHRLYVSDALRGEIRTVPTTGGPATLWAAGPALAAGGALGANGLKFHGGALWAANSGQGTVLRIPVDTAGRAGTPEVRASDLPGIDDFAFTGCGDRLLATLNQSDQVALVEPDGTHTIVLTAQDGLQNPTSVAVRGDTVYVPSAAYVTRTDPNLLVAHLQH
ncbi:hypothetical protein GCM10009665_35220 [Kitasatospora nipponensis]|uniref:Sugar lactone lactonase YvrE n=1 Tax=Kitasatospora nipponensis TaxID=258049 RepID=A0ABN1WDC0_9ACTN